MTSKDVREARARIVREHMDSENRHALDETVRTFAEPRYEVMPTGETHAGSDAVAKFLNETLTAFPDFRVEEKAMHHADDAVLVEVEFRGTHLGAWRGLPATGKRVAYRMCNVFVFEGDRLLCERLYFDVLTVLRQVGIARDPTTLSGRIATFVNHPITVLSAALRSVGKTSLK